jgi:predicted transcriptional regulator
MIYSKIIQMYFAGFSYRKIAKILNISKTKVERVIKQYISNTKQGRTKASLPDIPEEIRKKIDLLLKHKTEEKGRIRTLSISQIYSVLEIELREYGITKNKFYRFINENYKECLLQRIDKKEHNKIRANKGNIIRKEKTVEIDATGYTYEGKRYFILQAMDQVSGAMLDFMIVESKEKNTNYYNKAFNELDFMYFLYSLFKKYGIPQSIKIDNEAFMNTENISRALEELSVKIDRAKPYNPREKLIERAFRTLKEELRLLRAISKEKFEKLWEEAVKIYNTKEHNFLAGKWIPAEKFQPYSPPEDEDKLREALSPTFRRKIVNGYIRIENKTYFFKDEEYQHQYGRKKKNKEVIVKIDIENNTKAYIYDGKKYIGTATLITQPISLSTIEEKEIKLHTKRIERKKKKLQEQIQQLQEYQPEPEEKPQSFEEIFIEVEEKEVKEDIPDLPDLLEIFKI